MQRRFAAFVPQIAKHVLVVSALLTAGAFAGRSPGTNRSRVDPGQPFEFLMTTEESRAWSRISADTDARAFVEVFWARRDPTPDSARNEFREEFEARVTYADVNFGERRRRSQPMRGSLTERGKAYILFGPPTRKTLVALAAPALDLADPRQPQSKGVDAFPADARRGETWVWTYEGITAIISFGLVTAELQFEDRLDNGTFRLQSRFDVRAAEERVRQGAIRQPNLTWAPKASTPP